MNKREREQIRNLTEHLLKIVGGERPVGILSVAAVDPELGGLAEAVRALEHSLDEAQNFINALSQGNFEIDPPARNRLIASFKQLHANLRHLTWQTKQIAAGDLNQQVDFLGEFSVAFNAMIAALREKKVAEEKLRYLSIHDTLTGLYNRAYFSEEIARLERSRRFPVSVLVIDLDGLKSVNDTLGHAAGDRLIQEAAQVLHQGVRADDVLARIGGDEFAMLLPDTDECAAARVINRIRESEVVHNLEHGEPFLGISIGVATTMHRDQLSEAFKLADNRMYQDKSIRKGLVTGLEDFDPCRP